MAENALPESGLITIKNGPQFGGMASRVALFGLMLLAAITVTSLLNEVYETSAIALGLLLLVLPFFLDYQGVQINLDEQKIRHYQAYYFFRWGHWLDLSKYQKLELRWERLRYKSGSATLPDAGISARKVTSDIYWVSLTAKGSKRFPIAEFPSQRSARKFMMKYAQILDLPWEDHYQKRKEAAFKTRERVEARRKR